MGSADIRYQSGFGNEHATEAVSGALPQGQNSPQRAPLGLYAEQLSGTPFTAPRSLNRRTWTYRIRPSSLHRPFAQVPAGLWQSPPLADISVSPNQLRWDPLPFPSTPTDLIAGMATMASNGDVGLATGIAIHIYTANAPMRRYFYDADGELLIVPQLGGLEIHTELGRLDVVPGEICVIPRGIKFRVDLPDGEARGYICENYGALLRLPDLGPIGANGLANPRHFQYPMAAYEDLEGDFRLAARFQGHLWEAKIGHSPLDVVAWHGTYAPYKYELSQYNTINTVSYDHPDPSIFTVLTSPLDTQGTANVDFVIFPPRWVVAEHTFRPPYFHRNVMSEFMGLIFGQYEAKGTGFIPGGASLHNCMSGHGPDADSFEKASGTDLAPQKYGNTLAFMFESRYVIRPTRFALETAALQPDYFECWQGLRKNFWVE
jgi:homogentisate 1,2-dioxygenase